MDDKKRNILFTEEQIKTRIAELGKVLTEEYKDKKLYVLPFLEVALFLEQIYLELLIVKLKLVL